MEYYPQSTPLTLSDVRELEKVLDEWQISLPPLLQFPLSMLPPSSDTDKVIYVQRAMLHMTYLTVVIALHCSWSYSAQPTDELWEDIFGNLSAWKLEFASRDITTIANTLQVNNLTTGLQTPLGLFSRRL